MTVSIFHHLGDKMSQIIWAEVFWLPPGANWTVMTSTEENGYPNFNDVYVPIGMAFCVLFIRFWFEWLIARPLGRALGIKDTYSELPSVFARVLTFIIACVTGRRQDEICTSITTDTVSDLPNGKAAVVANVIVTTKKKPVSEDDSCIPNGVIVAKHRRTNSEPLAFSDASDHFPIIVKKHRRTKSAFQRKQQKGSSLVSSISLKRPTLVQVKSTLDKFAESCWRGVYYIFIFAFGFYCLWDKPYLWDTLYCWYGYPYQAIPNEIWWYYMIEAAFYWSLMLSQFVDVQRKDFWVNFVHHIATLFLIYFSWTNNVVRAGAITLMVHDAADFWMEGAKMARYTNHNSLCNVLFIIFASVWVITRCVVFPFKVVWTTLVEAPSLVGYCFAHIPMNFLMFVLLVLHIFWSYMIWRIAIQALRSGQTDDTRSDDEDEEIDGASPTAEHRIAKERRRKCKAA